MPMFWQAASSSAATSTAGNANLLSAMFIGSPLGFVQPPRAALSYTGARAGRMRPPARSGAGSRQRVAREGRLRSESGQECAPMPWEPIRRLQELERAIWSPRRLALATWKGFAIRTARLGIVLARDLITGSLTL